MWTKNLSSGEVTVELLCVVFFLFFFNTSALDLMETEL